MDLEAIPPPPREPTVRARELVFRFQGGQGALLIIGVAFTLMGSLFTPIFCWGLPTDLALLFGSKAVTAEVLSSEVNRSATVNDQHPTEIRFAYRVNGVRYQGRSSTLQAAPAEAGETVRVEVSGFDPSMARVAGTTRNTFGYAAGLVVLFPLVGVAMVIWVIRASVRRKRAFREGLPARARSTYFGPDTSVRVNGRNPWHVKYEFEVDGRLFQGRLSHMDRTRLEGLEGALIALYDPADPSCNTLWL